jgi:formylglycine-generating enzyme required for sulfatase activity
MKNCFAVAALVLFAACGQSPAPSSTAEKSDASASAGRASVPASQASAGQGPTEFKTASGIEMVLLPGGQFTMGTDKGNPDEVPAHPVTLTGFAIDKFEVTSEMFAKAQLPNPSHWGDNPKRPVERVRWRDAKQYCNERSALEGLKPCYNEKTADWECDYSANGYRLPTEAEWEYACKAGTDAAYDFGGASNLRQYSWCAENSEEKTHPVGQKKPNRWGIYDLYGNVSEWCEDVYSPTYYKNSPAKDPVGPPSPGKDVQRVMRGGSWKSTPEMCRATFRQGQKTGDTDACFYTDYCGFRCVRRITAEELTKLKGR